MSLAGARVVFFHCSLSLVPTPMFCIPGFCYSVTKLYNKACVVCESDVVAFSLSNHVIQFI